MKKSYINQFIVIVLFSVLIFSWKDNDNEPQKNNQAPAYLNKESGWEHIFKADVPDDAGVMKPATYAHDAASLAINNDVLLFHTRSERNVNGVIVYDHFHTIPLNNVQSATSKYSRGDLANYYILFDNTSVIYQGKVTYIGVSTFSVTLDGDDGIKRYKNTASPGTMFLRTADNKFYHPGNGYNFSEIAEGGLGETYNNPLYPSMLQHNYFYSTSNKLLHVIFNYNNNIQVAVASKESKNLSNVSWYDDSKSLQWSDSLILKVGNSSNGINFPILIYEPIQGNITVLDYNVLSRKFQKKFNNSGCIKQADFVDISEQYEVYLSKNYNTLQQYTSAGSKNISLDIVSKSISNAHYYHLNRLWLKEGKIYGSVLYYPAKPEIPHLNLIRLK